MNIYKEIEGKSLRKSVVVFIVADNKALLVKRNSKLKTFPGAWSFVGGKCDPEDGSYSEAAIRELFEETGICLASASTMNDCKWLKEYNDIKNGYSIKFFNLHYSQIPEIKISNEHEDYFWCPIELLLDVLSDDVPESRQFVKDYIALQ